MKFGRIGTILGAHLAGRGERTARLTKSDGPFGKEPATTYSPTGLPRQYHARGRA